MTDVTGRTFGRTFYNGKRTMNLVYFNDLLRQFVHSHPGVEDAVIVSSDAELVSIPIRGWGSDSAIGMALAMFQMSSSTRENLNWRALDQIWLQGGSRHFVGIFCSHAMLLLIKAGEKVILPELRLEVNRLAQKIQTEISYAETSILSPPEYLNFTGSIFPQIDGDILPKKTTIANEPKLRTSRFFEPLQRNFLEKRPLLF
ncbi:MAG: hypothetical protein WA865_03220 [Spirulinaceae cyanobacterium]